MTSNEEFEYERDQSWLIWSETDIQYKELPSYPREYNFSFSPPEELLENKSSVYLHCFFTTPNALLDESKRKFNSRQVTYKMIPLVSLRKKKKNRELKKLMGGVKSEEKEGDYDDGSEEERSLVEGGIESELIPHWRPKVNLALVKDMPGFKVGTIPSPILKHLHFYEETGELYPTLYDNDFWLLSTSFTPLNSSLAGEPLNLSLSFNLISMWQWQLQNQMDVRKTEK